LIARFAQFEKTVVINRGGKVKNRGNLNKASGRTSIALWLIVSAVLVATLFLVNPPRAHATLTLQLIDGVTTVSVTDGGFGDFNPVVGAVTYIGSVGNFILNVSTAITYPVLGTPTLPTIDLNSINLSSSSSGGSLTVAASEMGYTGTGGNFLLAVGGTTGGTVSAQSYLGTTNTLFGTSTLLGSLGPFTGAFSGTTGGSVAATGPYSLTTVAAINHPAGIITTSLDVFMQLPEPASLLLLGSGLTIFGLVGMRRSRSKENDLL
jgi:hypothetical protein